MMKFILAFGFSVLISSTTYAQQTYVCIKTASGCQIVDATHPLPVTTGSSDPFEVVVVPSSVAADGIVPVVSTSAEATHVLKSSAGNLYGVYAVNLTSTSGFLVVVNATSAPADGAITPLACVSLAANSVASLNYQPGPPAVYSTGITAVITSATTCFTKTTGVITGFIGGAVK